MSNIVRTVCYTQPKPTKNFLHKGSCSKEDVNTLSQKYEIRRPHFLGNKEASCRVILPAKLVENIGIMKGDYLRIYEENSRLVIERMANQSDDNGGKIDNR